MTGAAALTDPVTLADDEGAASPLAFDVADVEDVLWSVTYRCNLECIYCSVDAGPCLPTPPELTHERVDRILEQLGTLPGLRSVILSGGEFLLSRHRGYILDALCGRDGLNVFVITNGTYLPARLLATLETYRPTVMVSIDSTRESANAVTRGADKLRRSAQTTETLLGAGLEIVVIAVVTKHNIATIADDVAFWSDVGVRNMLLQQLHAEGRGSPLFHSLSPRPEQIEKLHAELVRLESEHPEMTIDSNEICLFPSRESYHQRVCDPEKRYRPQRVFMCGAGYKFLAITPTGDVIPCNAMQSFVAGNVFASDLTDILVGSEVFKGIRAWRRLRVDAIEGCSTCPFNAICDGGCRADVLNIGRDLLSPHPYCGRNTAA